MGERSGAPSGFSPPSIVISKPPVAVQLPQPDVSANRDAPQALVLTASTVSVQAEDRDCAVDLKSLCAGITPGGGRVHACIQAHISELSVGCSSRLSKAAWVAKECAADIQHFCP